MPERDISTIPPAPEYPEREPFATHRLHVSKFHTVYVEESGNPEGIPVLFLHGGPGSGFNSKHRRLFDPARFRTVLVDQRGAGQSTPHASLQQNTTWHLVSDLELIRETLGIQRWIVFGGSWGSTLALAYAQSFPEACASLVLRGIFLGTDEEVNWFYQHGAHRFSPKEWEDYTRFIPEEERHEMVKAYYRRLTSPDEAMRLEACKRWARWEVANCTLLTDDAFIAQFTVDDHAVSLARIEAHYFLNHCFFDAETAILNPARIARIQHIPTTIVQGRYDLVCPLSSAWALYRALPGATFILAPEAGHASSEKGIRDALHWAVHQHPATVEAFSA